MKNKVYEYYRRYEKGTSEEDIKEEASQHTYNYFINMGLDSNKLVLDLTNLGDAGENTDMYAHIYYEEKK